MCVPIPQHFLLLLRKPEMDNNIHDQLDVWITLWRRQDFIQDLTSMLNAGANPNAKNILGESVLHRFVLIPSSPGRNTLRATKYLLDHGANPNITDNDGCSPLHICRDIDFVKLLIEYGADVNALNHARQTPLLTVTHHYNIMQYLLEHGARFDIKDTECPLEHTIKAIGATTHGYATTHDLAKIQLLTNAGITPTYDQLQRLQPLVEEGLNLITEYNDYINMNPSKIDFTPLKTIFRL